MPMLFICLCSLYIVNYFSNSYVCLNIKENFVLPLYKCFLAEESFHRVFFERPKFTQSYSARLLKKMSTSKANLQSAIQQ